MAKIFPDRFAGGIMEPEFYVSLVTMHGTIMVFFLFTAVLTGGFGNFLIPLQIGARDMAFPFLNALSYWIFLLSCIVIFSALFVTRAHLSEDGRPTRRSAPYPAQRPGQGTGMTLWITAIALFTASGLMGGLELHHDDSDDADQGPVDDAAAADAVVAAHHRDSRLARISRCCWRAAILLTFDRVGGTSFFIPPASS